MNVEQIYTSCLSQASYYLESAGEVAIIDPGREVDHFIEKANKNKSKIKFIFQTHFHADFVSGHFTLAKITGSPIVYGPKADPSNNYIIANDGDFFKIGDVKIKVIHTPGHTLESTSYLLYDKDNNQHSIFTGDTLFLGDVGIPDVAQRYKGMSKEELASILYDSINNKIKPLDDSIIVYPGHGAGSACGKNMMKETIDTLSNQMKVNYSLNGILSKDEFVKNLTENIPEPPAYFPANVKLNQEGYDDLNDVLKRSLNKISVLNFKDLINDKKIIVLDTRDSNQFVKSHINKSIFIGLNGRFAPWVGEILKDVNTPLIIVCNKGKEKEAITRLSRIGFDNCLGFISFEDDKEIELYSETNSINCLNPLEYVEINDSLNSLDVRSVNEFNGGSFKKSRNIPLNNIDEMKDSIRKDNNLYIFCAGGYRSVIASSILMKNGFKNIVNVNKGFAGIKNIIDNDI